MTTLDRIAAVMACTPEDDDDLVEAVRLLVAERDEAKADRARLREYIDDCGRLAVGLVERVHKAVEAYQCVVRERDASVAQRDALAGASRRYIAAADAFLADACASEPEHAAALRALVAALAAAGGGA
jgi:hypothetical protein